MDYYEILGVSRNSEEKEIQAAFRKIAFKYHPDRHSSATPDVKIEVAQKFKAATEAYETLIDGRKRSQYNLKGPASTSQSSQYRHYNPHSYNYQGYTKQRSSRGNVFNFFSVFARGMTRTDAIFHSVMAGTLVFGAICAGSVGDYLWRSWNSGRLYSDIEKVDRRTSKVVNIRKPPKKPDDFAADSGRGVVSSSEEHQACSSAQAARGSERDPPVVVAERPHSQAQSGAELPGGRETDALSSETAFSLRAPVDNTGRQRHVNPEQSSAAPKTLATATEPELRSKADESATETQRRCSQADRAFTEAQSGEDPLIEPSLQSPAPPHS